MISPCALKYDRFPKTMVQHIDKTIIINAPPAAVWEALTDIDVMKAWMAEPELDLKIITDWKIGNTIVIKGFHHVRFENTGVVLQFEPEKILAYNFLSSLSRLPDKPDNYSIVEFSVTPLESETSLRLTLRNFPTEAIFKHLDFYWSATLEIMKKWIEKQDSRQ